MGGWLIEASDGVHCLSVGCLHRQRSLPAVVPVQAGAYRTGRHEALQSDFHKLVPTCTESPMIPALYRCPSC